MPGAHFSQGYNRAREKLGINRGLTYRVKTPDASREEVNKRVWAQSVTMKDELISWSEQIERGRGVKREGLDERRERRDE